MNIFGCALQYCYTKLMLKVTKASLNFIRLLRLIITPSVIVVELLRGENDSKQSDEFQARLKREKNCPSSVGHRNTKILPCYTIAFLPSLASDKLPYKV